MTHTPPAAHPVNAPAAEPAPEPVGRQMQVIDAAMPDLLCWMYAAVPLNERTGGLNARRFAQIFEVAPATVYRWIREAHGRQFSDDARHQLRSLAALRGHGEMLWPTIDAGTAARQDSYLATAITGRHNMRRNRSTAAAIKAARPTQVITYYNDAARVFGVFVATSTTNRRRYLAPRSGNRAVDEITAPDTYTATIIKYTLLQLMGDDRCIAPEALIPKGRTEVWRRLHHDRAGHARYPTDVDLATIAAPIIAS